MAGTIVAGTLSDGTYSGSVTDTVRGACKAWVNFNGTGTVAIRAAYNVSSITDNGTGDYTVNFTTAMQDTNYAWTAGCRDLDDPLGLSFIGQRLSDTTSASQLRIIACYPATSSLYDQAAVNIAIFR